MSFQMDERVDEVLEEGAYRATLENVEVKDTKFGERLMWTFDLSEHNTQVVGFTSMSPSTKANPYQWAKAIMGEIDPKVGWGSEDVIGGECIVVLEVAEDSQGVEKNKVVKVKQSKKDEAQTKSSESLNDPDLGHILF